MLIWAIVFFLLAVTAAVIGFSGISGTGAPVTRIAQASYGLFFVLFIVTMVLRQLSAPRRQSRDRSSRRPTSRSRPPRSDA